MRMRALLVIPALLGTVISAPPAIAAGTTPCAPLAHANDSLKSASMRMAQTVAGHEFVTTIAYVHPDRAEIKASSATTTSELIRIGSHAWKRTNGEGWESVAVPSTPQFDGALHFTGSCTDAGTTAWRGTTAHVYRGTVVALGIPMDATLYVLADGRIHAMTMDGSQGGLVTHATVDIGSFNAVTIEPPNTSGVD